VGRAIRFVIPAAALVAVAIGIALPTPDSLPQVALGSRELLWLERSLVFFYGFLLLFVPLLRALAGELPIELTARGARYAEASERALEELDARLSEAERLLDETLEFVDSMAELESDRDDA
jgi:glutathione S-transferase